MLVKIKYALLFYILTEYIVTHTPSMFNCYSNTPLCFVYITVNGTRAWVTYTFYHENIALY